MYQWGMIICGNIWQKKNHVHSVTSLWIVIVEFKVTTLSETYRFWSSATKALLDKSTGRHRDVCQVRLADTQKTDALRALPDMESEKRGREDGFCVICLCSVVSWVAHTTHIGPNKSSFMYLHHLGLEKQNQRIQQCYYNLIHQRELQSCAQSEVSSTRICDWPFEKTGNMSVEGQGVAYQDTENFSTQIGTVIELGQFLQQSVGGLWQLTVGWYNRSFIFDWFTYWYLSTRRLYLRSFGRFQSGYQ